MVDFTLIGGASGGPNWSLIKFKGPAAGAAQFASVMRTNLDSVTITFVPTCQYNVLKTANGIPAFWTTIPSCNPLDPTQRQNAISFGLANNVQMLLRSEGLGVLKQP